jgi:N6-L-threonylcarbamoyladenine synthase
MTTKIVLGIETSCDDTSIAVLKGTPGSAVPAEVLAFNLFSQEQILAKWGGVVPEIAARNHLQKLVPLLKYTIEEANISLDEIDVIGVTTNPGLLGPLLTGLNGAKTLAMYLEKPIIAVNHLYAHLEAIHLTQEHEYPYMGILTSGGHSLFLLVESPTSFEILGTTIDDAAGEAFDKGGKLLGLGYPAGRIIDDLAKKGDPLKFEFPIGLRSSGTADLSYSGLKTSLRTFIEKNPDMDFNGRSESEYNQKLFDVCASYQHAIVAAIKLKLRYAMKAATEKTGKQLPIVLGGGVACNSYLREVLKKHYKKVSFVEPKYCTDNGAMVANYALRIFDQAIPFPECLTLDAKGRFIAKGEVLKAAVKKEREKRKR